MQDLNPRVFGVHHVGPHMHRGAIALAVCLALLVGAQFSASATGASLCAGQALTEVNSLGALPEEVGTALGKHKVGLDGIAEKGQSYNVTDAVNEKLPMRRFALAGANVNCALVAVEHGGRGHSVDLWLFEQRDAEWKSKKLQSVSSVPTSVEALRANAHE